MLTREDKTTGGGEVIETGDTIGYTKYRRVHITW